MDFDIEELPGLRVFEIIGMVGENMRVSQAVIDVVTGIDQMPEGPKKDEKIAYVCAQFRLCEIARLGADLAFVAAAIIVLWILT